MASPSYLIILTGAGPTRAAVERVTHVVYLASRTDDRITILPFDGLKDLLTSRGVHCTSLDRHGVEYVSIAIPTLPRGYVSGQMGGVMYSIPGTSEDEARDVLVEWCVTNAVGPS
jgi:hypothetical protein